MFLQNSQFTYNLSFGGRSAHLVGNVWTKELVPYNESGEILKDMSVVPNLYAEELGCRLLQEKRSLDDLEEFDKVSEETSAHLDMDVWKPVREGILKELICVSGRGFKSVDRSSSCQTKCHQPNIHETAV